MLEEVRTRRRRQRRAAVGDSVNGGNEEKEKTKTKKRTKIWKGLRFPAPYSPLQSRSFRPDCTNRRLARDSNDRARKIPRTTVSENNQSQGLPGRDPPAPAVGPTRAPVDRESSNPEYCNLEESRRDLSTRIGELASSMRAQAFGLWADGDGDGDGAGGGGDIGSGSPLRRSSARNNSAIWAAFEH
ncbi:hypothetical protein AXG93_4876s1100 [Marchantia polymorpha subsp. ruderalis]|uniref:Uncharacterized protein n=1 Tax=Marchantia polymorpha subsp. ruderalis TaxID=1480154 RepID=A0A176WCF8_MARPO|nr:hypothetical protein AXG93_4876s1100 [Marchantia polymorpha subsp. ruderalis]